jgi:hypothetical protein
MTLRRGERLSALNEELERVSCPACQTGCQAIPEASHKVSACRHAKRKIEHTYHSLRLHQPKNHRKLAYPVSCHLEQVSSGWKMLGDGAA